MELVKQFSPRFLISGAAPTQVSSHHDQTLDDAGEMMAKLILGVAPKTPFTADSMAKELAKDWETLSAIEIAPVLQSMAKAGKLFIVSKDFRGNPVYLSRGQ